MLAAGGLLEGCLRAPRPLPPSAAGPVLLEDIVASSCRQVYLCHSHHQALHVYLSDIQSHCALQRKLMWC